MQQERKAAHDRIAQVIAAVFSTDDGREMLEYLVKRFDLAGRTFLPIGERGEINALRAAVRDGERAVIAHLLALARAANPKFSISI